LIIARGQRRRVRRAEASFLAVDEHGRIPGVADVFAGGDATTFPLKQGGLAAQQADAAAEAFAADSALPPSRRRLGRYRGALADRRRAAVPARRFNSDRPIQGQQRAPHDGSEVVSWA
jgi:NADH dehydrogenase FAD-containing subunit